MFRIYWPAVLVVQLLLCLPTLAQINVQYLGNLDTDITSLPVNPNSTCLFGNLRAPGTTEPFGMDIMFFHADFDSLACECAGGWMVSAIHVFLANDSEGPIEPVMDIIVDGQGWGTYPSGCAEPHPGYWGELFEVQASIPMPDPGYYEVIVTATSPCAFFGHEYFLELWTQNDQVKLILDEDGYRECEALEGVHIGSHWWWIDPHGALWSLSSGSPIWWVEAMCCENPVTTESRSWSTVKSLYH